jgi:flagellar assembly protein FliH
VVAGVLRREKFCSSPAFSFQDLEGEARSVVEQAHQEARRILAEAEQEGRRRAAQLQREAIPQGREQGRREAFEQAREEAARVAIEEARRDYAQLCQALTTGLEAFESNKRRLLAMAESGLLELALAIGRRVCKHDVGASSEAARANAAALLEMVKHESDLELRLNPADHQTLSTVADELIATTDRRAHVRLVADPGVERGDCILESRSGTIDARVETQLDRVAAALRGNSESTGLVTDR